MSSKSSRLFFEHPLARARKLRGWTQQHVADALDIDPNTYSRWERGVNQPSQHHRLQLCQLFKCSAEALGLPADPPVFDPTRLPSVTPTGRRLLDLVLPSPPASLVGREREYQQLKSRLCRPLPGSVTVLSGLPGVGKTALARTLVHDEHLRQYFQDGMFWATLGPDPHIPTVLRQWSTLLGLSAEQVGSLSDQRALFLAVRERVGTRRMLVILDDAWELEAVTACKVGGPRCAYLVTTRIASLATRLSLESHVVVPPLSEEESLHLLHLLIPQIFSYEPHLVQRLIQAVGGLPLALMLIGQSLRPHIASGQSRRIRAALEDLLQAPTRFQLSELAESGDLSAEEEEKSTQSLFSIIARSEKHLSEQARVGLSALSVFPSTPYRFTEEAAVAVMEQPVQMLDQLVDAGLVKSHGQGRYSLHPVMVDYARLSLHTEEEATVRTRFLRYVQSFVEEHAGDDRFLDDEREMIQTALALAARLPHAASLVALVCACVPYWLAHGETEQARTWLQETQATASDLDDPHEHSWLWLRQGELAQKQGQVRQAAACFQEGFRLSRDQPEAVLRAALLTGLAEVSCQRGQLLHARIYGEEALLQARQIGRQDLLYRTLLSLSQTWYMQGDIRAARTAIAEVLAGVEHASQAGVRCRALLHYGQLCEDSGDFPQAQTNYREALRLAKHKEDKDGVCAALIALSRGMLARRMTFDEQLRLQIKPDQRELSRIRHLIEHARKVAKQLAHPGYLCRILILEGWLAHQLGDRMTMERAWSEALLLAHHLEEPLVASAALLGLGEIAMQQHQWQEATGHLVQAAALAGEGHPYRGWAELQLAKIAVEQGHYQEACRQGQAAATTFTDIGFHLAPCVQLWVEYLPERGNLLNSEKDLCNEHV